MPQPAALLLLLAACRHVSAPDCCAQRCPPTEDAQTSVPRTISRAFTGEPERETAHLAQRESRDLKKRTLRQFTLFSNKCGIPLLVTHFQQPWVEETNWTTNYTSLFRTVEPAVCPQGVYSSLRTCSSQGTRLQIPPRSKASFLNGHLLEDSLRFHSHATKEQVGSRRECSLHLSLLMRKGGFKCKL